MDNLHDQLFWTKTGFEALPADCAAGDGAARHKANDLTHGTPFVLWELTAGRVYTPIEG